MPISDALLRGFARTLPREFRERVFEPALADIRLGQQTGGRRSLARAVLVVECLRLGMPRHFWARGRPTRLAVAVVIVIALGALLVARRRYAADWRDEAPGRRQRVLSTG